MKTACRSWSYPWMGGLRIRFLRPLGPPRHVDRFSHPLAKRFTTLEQIGGHFVVLHHLAPFTEGLEGSHPRRHKKEQAEYIGVKREGPYKPEHYRY